LAQGVDGYWYAYIGAYGYIDDSGSEDYDSADNNLDYGVNLNPNVAGNMPAGNGAGSGAVAWSGGASDVFISAGNSGVLANSPTLSDYNGTNNVGTSPNNK